MKRTLAFLILCALMVTSVLAQTEKYSGYSITFTAAKKSGTAVFEGRMFDEVWSAVTKALMTLKYRIRTSEKTSGTISAVQKEKGFSKLIGALGSRDDREDLAEDTRKWDIFVEATEDGGVKVFFVAEDVPKPKRYIQSLCKSIAELLPPIK